MKQIGLSVLSVIAVLIGFRIFSPAAKAAPSDIFHVAYLLAPDTEFTSDFVRPENILKNLAGQKIDVVYSWAELLATHARLPLDGLVLHNSALPMVDFEWIANAYWNGMTLSTLEIRPTMLAHLYDHGCLPFGDYIPVAQTPPYSTISTLMILSLHDEAVSWHRRDWRRNCKYPIPAEITRVTKTGWLYGSGPLINEDIHNSYQEIFLDHMVFKREVTEEFIEQNKDSQDMIMRLSR